MSVFKKTGARGTKSRWQQRVPPMIAWGHSSIERDFLRVVLALHAIQRARTKRTVTMRVTTMRQCFCSSCLFDYVSLVKTRESVAN